MPLRFVSDSLLATANKNPDKTAVVIDGVEYKYHQLETAARKLANVFIENGVERGDRVAIYMDNTWPCVVGIYAVLLAGGVFLVVNQQTKADKLHYILEDSGSKILLTDITQEKQLINGLHDLEVLKGVICSGNAEKVQKLTLANKTVFVKHFEHILETAVEFTSDINKTPSDLAALIYTSGSTGDPKGVMHTHLSMTFALNSLVEYLRLSEDEVMINVLPVAFDYGLYQLLMAVHLGATLVLERSIAYPAVLFKLIDKYKVTSLPGVPTIFSMLLSIHKREALCFPSVTRVTNTAAALPADYINDLQEIFPNALIYKMYGMTECKRVCYLEPELINEKGRSVGKAIPGTEVFVLNDKNEIASPGEIGTLYVRGPHIMAGYWNKPEPTSKMLKSGAWSSDVVLCTQDEFYCDEDGLLYFVGRSDDIIKTRGEKVSPVEVENMLHGIEGIRDAVVIGVDDELLGQSIHAFITINDDSDLNENKIKRLCAQKIENYMVPQKINIVDELPKTDTGKITKKSLSKTQ